MVNFKKINFKIGKKHILKNINFSTIKKGAVCIIGENGSGKTTLIKQISSKARFSGELMINGKEVRQYKRNELPKLISFLPQKIDFPSNLMCEDIIKIGRNPHTNLWGILTMKDKKIINKYTKLTGIKNLMKKQFGSLSGGQQQRVVLTMALVQETDIMVFDEPTNHLDVKYQIQFYKMVEEFKKTKLVILTTHNINHAAKYGDQFLFLKDGRAVVSGNKKIITKSNLKKVLGIDAKITNVNGNPIISDMDIKGSE